MQRTPTKQATRIRLASLQAFALLLSLLAPSKATKTLHEMKHALVRQQLLVMPRIEEQKAARGAGQGVTYTKSPGVKKQSSGKIMWLQKEVQLAGSSAPRHWAVVCVESRSAAGCQTLHAWCFQL